MQFGSLKRSTKLVPLLLGLLVMAGSASPTAAEDNNGLQIYTVEETFDDAAFYVENAIVDRGYKIDYRGHVGAMMERTAKDFDDAQPIYKSADFFTFCSARLSRAMIEADPANVGFCPYVIFVYELADEPGKSHVGFRPLPLVGSEASQSALNEINELLNAIAEEATE